ncbi:pilus assembly protein TadG, partial [Burkholderia pseudomallei]|nr:pilus assembly protein TadG [Burkholderia pseudomallei]
MSRVTSSSGGARPCGRRRQRGVVSIIVGLLVAVVIGFVGRALDLGKVYVTRSERENR